MDYARTAGKIIESPEGFWNTCGESSSPYELLRFSAFLGLFPFAGYMFYYTVIGKIWNYWPFMHSTLTVTYAVVCAGMQWVLFTTFPIVCSMVLERTNRRFSPDFTWERALMILTYSMTPLLVATIFIGIPFLERLAALFGFSSFAYILFYGLRTILRRSIISSAFWTFAILFLFAAYRQMFVTVIGF